MATLLVAMTSYFLLVYRLYKKIIPSNDVWNMHIKMTVIISIIFCLSYFMSQGNSKSLYWVALSFMLLPFFPLMLICHLSNQSFDTILAFVMIILSMWIHCICYYYIFKDQVNLKLNKIHFVRNIMIFILGYSVVLGMLFLGKEEVIEDNETHTVNLNICDENGKLASYSTSDKESINSLLNFVGITVKSQNKITYNVQQSLSSGISYQLDFIGKDTFSYKVINGYCIYNDTIYEIDYYDIETEGILHNFGIK